MPTPTPEPAHRPQGQQLDGTDLQEVLDSAANAGDLGKQQFFTPRPIAAALATPLPFTRPVFVDLMMGDGALIAGAFADLPPLAAMGHLHATRRGLGVDLDRRCARQPADLATPVDTCAADLTEFYPLLAEMNWQYDCGGFNPPFSLQWHTDRLAALADSEIAAVRQCFRKGREHTDSTLASLLIALDRQTPMGEGYFICNHSTAVKLLGDPDQPAQPDDLAMADRKADVGEAAGQAEVLDRQRDSAERRALLVHVFFEGPADHPPDDFGIAQIEPGELCDVADIKLVTHGRA